MDEKVWCAGVSGMSNKRKVEHMDSVEERNKVCFRLLGYGHTCVKIRVWPSPAGTKFASKFGNVEQFRVNPYFVQLWALQRLAAAGPGALRQVNCPPHQFYNPLRVEPTRKSQTGQWFYVLASPIRPRFSFCYLIHGATRVYIRTTNQSLNLPIKEVFMRFDKQSNNHS